MYNQNNMNIPKQKETESIKQQIREIIALALFLVEKFSKNKTINDNTSNLTNLKQT